MIKKKIYIYCLLLLACLCCLLGACGKEKQKQLAMPNNVRVEEKTLIWDEVDNAEGYILYYGSKDFYTEECRYDLSALPQGYTYEIKIFAVGNGKKYTDSKTAKYIYEAEGQKPLEETKGLEYTLLPDGSGYKVSKGNASLYGRLVIPDYHLGLPVKMIPQSGFSDYILNVGHVENTITTEIHLPETLESIGGSAFSDFKALREIVIPESVTELGGAAFQRCGIRKAVLPSKLTTLNDVFRDCANLEEINLPDTIERIVMGAMSGTKWLENQPDGFVVHNGICFNYKGTLGTVLEIPSTIKVLNVSFAGNKTIRRVVIPNGVEVDGISFRNSTALEEVVLPDDVTAMTSSDYSFAGCTSLKKIDFPDGLTELNGPIFENCTSLKEVSFPSTLKTISAERGNAFNDCTALERVDLPEGLETVGGFSGCTALKTITLPSTLKKVGIFARSGLTEITIPANVTSVGSFVRCESLKTVVFLGEETSLNIGSTFKECTALESVKLPKKMGKIGSSAFEGCVSLKEVVMPSSLEAIERNAFYGCESLQEIVFPSNLKEIGREAFKNCTNLKKAVWNGEDAATHVEDYAFYNTGLTEVTLPASLTFGGSLLGSYEVFARCKSLKKVIAYCEVVPDFSECPALEEVILHEGVKEISSDAFKGATALKEISLPSTLEKIGSSVFSRTSLEILEIPDSVTEIGVWAFSKCPTLTTIILPKTMIDKMESVVRADSKKVDGVYPYIPNVYVKCTEKEWSELVTEDTVLPEGSTIYLYAETKEEMLSEDGHYWHYVDGKPVAWNKETE